MEAKKYLKWLVEGIKDDFADGLFVGATQMETGYRCTAELAKITMAQTMIDKLFEEEIGNE